MVRGDKAKAIGILRQVVKQDSNHVRAYLQLGNILRDENTEQAIKIHQSLTVRPNLSAEMKVDIHRALANDYKKIEAGAVRQATDGSTDINLGRYFNEQINIKPLLPYEGDYIIEGRYGNSIRFGATVKNDVLSETNINDWSQGDEPIGTPITIIRNGQSSELDEKGWVPTIEDVNR